LKRLRTKLLHRGPLETCGPWVAGWAALVESISMSRILLC